MSANGRVHDGFSYPVVAKYNRAGNTVTYTGGRALARGVEIALKLEVASGNDFYADDVVAESENGIFIKGTADLTVDGMHPESERFALGLPEAEEVTFGSAKLTVTKYGDSAKPPYLGLGYIVPYQSDGVEVYVPTILTKVKFRQPDFDAKTRGEKKDWQTQKLVADLHRDDTSNHNWKFVIGDYTTYDEAVAALNAALGVEAAANG